MYDFLNYYYHVQIVFAVLFSAFSIKEKERMTDRPNPTLWKGPGGPGLGREAEMESRPTYPEGGGQAGPGGREAL